MRSPMLLKLMIGPAALILLPACGGSGPQQAETTQAAATETLAERGAPAQQAPQPEAAPQPEPAPRPAPRPARQQPRPYAPPATPAATPAPAPAPRQVHMVDVPAGTVLTLALDTTLNSKTAQVGDRFTATVLEPVVIDGRAVIPGGCKVEGEVTEAVPAKRGAGRAKLAVSFDRLRLESGYETDIVGRFREVTESKKKRNAKIIGGAAAGGALLGRILGKDTKGAVIGSIIGGGIGTAVVVGKEGKQAKLPADTPFEIQLEEPVQVPHEPSRS